MIKIPHTPDHVANSQRVHGAEPCVVCGRGIKDPTRAKWLHMNTDGYAISKSEAASIGPDHDQGSFPIGPDCLRNHPELTPYAS